jgi:phage FluMu protein Com
MIKSNDKFWKEVRCAKCRSLLCFEYIFAGRIMIKCRKCGEKNEINYKSTRKVFDNQNNDNEMIIDRDKKKGGVRNG